MTILGNVTLKQFGPGGCVGNNSLTTFPISSFDIGLLEDFLLNSM